MNGINFRRRRGGMGTAVLCGVLLMSLSPVLSAMATVSAEAESEWQEAAFNYEYAAEAQETSAGLTLRQARALHDAPVEDAYKTRRGRIQAGNLEVRAADLLVAAAGNLEHASRTWRQAASAAGRDSSSYAFLKSAADTAFVKATALLRRAAELYEQAALGFAAQDEFLSQAAANQKAAGIRERLATRR